MTKKEIIKFLFFRTLGNFLLLFAITGVIATFGPSLYYEASWRVAQIKGIEYVLADDVNKAEDSELGKLLASYETERNSRQEPGLGDILAANNEKVLVPPDAEFSLVIPKIGAASKITANVDASNKEEYLRVLINSIAHAKGTAFPGLGGTTYIFAHSADNFWNIGRYNAVFYLLRELAPGDEIYVFFQGKRFNYVVTEQKVVDAADVHYIDAALGQGERLILQTCWPPGTDWRRTLIFAEPKSV